MKKDLWRNIIIPTILLMLFFVMLGVLKNEIYSTLLLIICIAVAFTVKYNSHEWILLATGVIIGAILEIGGDLLYKLQSWEMGSLFGLPLWLPLLWGFAFVMIYRTGNIIVKK